MQTNLTDGLLWYIVFLYSTTCHEAAHAWAALRLGDPTASDGGQVSLNPWPHLRRAPVGMFVVPVVSWLAGGWIIGWAGAPYSVGWARAHPRRAGLMAIAGPAANLCLMLGAALLLRLGLEWQCLSAPFTLTPGHIAVSNGGDLLGFAAHLLSIAASLNLLLFVFNLLPVPPLDGSSIPLLLLPENAAIRFADAMRSPLVRMIGLLILFRSSSLLFTPLFQTATALLYAGIPTT